jgi:SAM-dependent methyltransferase
MLSSNAGYAAEADALAVQYEETTFEAVHGRVLGLLPAAPARVLDVGAGTGRDAAALVRRGYAVVAVEPTAELRAHGRRIHAGVGIDWVDDSLPGLAAVPDAGPGFDAVLATAVWMHLDAGERVSAMERVAGLLRPAGLLFLTLRHGPVPAGRRMFDVGAEETVELASGHGLVPVHRSERADGHGRGGVSWSHVVLRRG